MEDDICPNCGSPVVGSPPDLMCPECGFTFADMEEIWDEQEGQQIIRDDGFDGDDGD